MLLYSHHKASQRQKLLILGTTHLIACSSRLAYSVYRRFIRSMASSENGTRDVFKIRSTRILKTNDKTAQHTDNGNKIMPQRDNNYNSYLEFKLYTEIKSNNEKVQLLTTIETLRHWRYWIRNAEKLSIANERVYFMKQITAGNISKSSKIAITTQREHFDSDMPINIVLVIDGTVVVCMQHFVAYPWHAFHIVKIVVLAASPIDLTETDQSLLPYLVLQSNNTVKTTHDNMSVTVLLILRKALHNF